MTLANLTIPNHIAFIMDGNGRWAKKRAMPRSVGHKYGAEATKVVLKRCRDIGIKIVSLFAFSTENWNRPEEEVREIFRLVNELVNDELDTFVKEGVKLVHMGRKDRLPEDILDSINKSIEATKEGKNYILNIGFDYGGRDEIVRTVKKLINEKKTDIDEQSFGKALDTMGVSDPDIVVRTSGEQRVSNFMMWQMAYSEFIFTKTLWPDMKAHDVDKIIVEFNNRNRRFGKI